MSGLGAAVAVGAVVLVGALVLRSWHHRVGRRIIDSARLPPDAAPVQQALRQFFRLQLGARRELAMPSVAAAALWQKFAQNPRAYTRFCEQALGKPLPHLAAEALGPDAERNDALRRTWYRCCREEGIDPRQPQRLPLLFALDAAIGFPGGLHYSAFEGQRRRSDDGNGIYFGADFGDSDAACGDAAGFGGECGSGGDGSDGDGGGGGGD